MKEQIIKFTDRDVDGYGMHITAVARVYGEDITNGVINRIKSAINEYIGSEYWDTDGCFHVAQEQLEKEGYKVQWINPCIEINF